MTMNIYLSGEIHSNWRDELKKEVAKSGLDVNWLAPVTDHTASDEVGVRILGPEEKAFWKDRKGASINSIRSRSGLEKADLVVVRFGEKYRQWNAAFDAGVASALGKPMIILHPEEFDHALKEVDAAAHAVARGIHQVAQIIKYLMVQE